MSRTALAKTPPMPLKEVDWIALRPEVTETLLQDITQRIVAAFQPYKVILFGSYAYGTPHAESDVDLLVIMDSEEYAARRIMRVSEVAKVPYLPMDVLVYTPAEIETRLAMRDFFFLEIMEKGRVLYQRAIGWGKVEYQVTMTLLEEWIEKAEADYAVVVDLNRRRKNPVLDMVCFHCQQCAEKYLKAYLIMLNTPPPRTHNLESLLNDCANYDATFSALMPLMQLLNPYSVEFRYPGVSATEAQAKNAVQMLRRLRRTLRKKLGL